MASTERIKLLAERIGKHGGTDEEATTAIWHLVKHLKQPRKSVQRDLRTLVDRGHLRVVGMVVAGKREKKFYGTDSIGMNMLKHEQDVTKALFSLARFDAKRRQDVDSRYRHDAEFGDWALEIDRGTEDRRKLESRIQIMKSSPFKILWVLPSAVRMHFVGALCEPLEERVFYTNLRYITERWVDWQGQPLKALLKRD